MKEKIKNSLAKEVIEDFQKRAEERRHKETEWKINMNFYLGNQFCGIGYGGQIEDSEKQYFWQEREVFNHIAPIIDVRLARLNEVRPKVTVVPASNDDKDIHTAKVSKKLLSSVSSSLNLSEKIRQAMKWSEICGTAFYKISWNNSKGDTLAFDEDGNKTSFGDVDISVCSPFEIYPDSATCMNLDDCQSLIHAKVLSCDEVKDIYGIETEGQTLSVFNFDKNANIGGLGYNSFNLKIIESSKKNSVLVLERYQKPSSKYKNGRLTIVVGDEVAFDGDLPYINGENGKRTFPFVKQVSIDVTGSFWGASLIDRLIPVQRAYNAVKNRKHEFLNRLSMGILKVEDGSVDIDNLEEEGLCPGKILIYRQGSTPPQYLDEETIPASFAEEEDKLLDEFRNISGISEVTGTDHLSSNLSGVALELIVQQDNLRLNSSVDIVKTCVKEIAKKILRMYRQFANFPRLSKIVGENGDVELFYFSKSDISSDDIAFETENEIGESISQKRQMVFDLLNAGILSDENGKLSNRMKSKILEMLGFGVWEGALDLNEIHSNKAERENIDISLGRDVKVSQVDDNELHISHHVAYLLSKVDIRPEIEEKFLEHINQHKSFIKGEENGK